MCQGCDKTDDRELHEMRQCACESSLAMVERTCNCPWDKCVCGELPDKDMELMKFVCTECMVLNPHNGKEITAACVFTTHATEGNDVHLVEEGICLMSGNQSAYWQRCRHA